MTNFETAGPFSLRGERPTMRTGRTILSRGDIGQPRPTPLSRIEAIGASIPALSPEELAEREDKARELRKQLGRKGLGQEVQNG